MMLHRSRAIFTAALIILMLFGTGCRANQGSRQTIVENGEKTVVIDNLENVLPKEGAALKKQVLENYRGFDFLSDTELIGYRFSESVFGEDRGVWSYGLNSKTYGEDLKIEAIPKFASLSKDKSKLIVIPDGPGNTEKLLLKTLGHEEISRYDIDKKTYIYTFNWQYSGEGLTSASGYLGEEVLRVLPDGTLKKYKIPVPKMHFIDSANFQGDSEYLYYSLYGEKEMGIFKYSWETHKIENIAPQWLITRMHLSPKGDRFAIVEGFKDTRDKAKLNVISMNGKLLYTIFEAIAIEYVEWQPDGKGIAFAALNRDGMTNLYHANLVDGQLHFLGEYPGYSIEKMAFDLESNQLMLTFLNRGQKVPKWTTHILTLKEGDGIYEK